MHIVYLPHKWKDSQTDGRIDILVQVLYEKRIALIYAARLSCVSVSRCLETSDSLTVHYVIVKWANYK